MCIDTSMRTGVKSIHMTRLQSRYLQNSKSQTHVNVVKTRLRSSWWNYSQQQQKTPQSENKSKPIPDITSARECLKRRMEQHFTKKHPEPVWIKGMVPAGCKLIRKAGIHVADVVTFVFQPYKLWSIIWFLFEYFSLILIFIMMHKKPNYHVSQFIFTTISVTLFYDISVGGTEH